MFFTGRPPLPNNINNSILKGQNIISDSYLFISFHFISFPLFFDFSPFSLFFC